MTTSFINWIMFLIITTLFCTTDNTWKERIDRFKFVGIIFLIFDYIHLFVVIYQHNL